MQHELLLLSKTRAGNQVEGLCMRRKQRKHAEAPAPLVHVLSLLDTSVLQVSGLRVHLQATYAGLAALLASAEGKAAPIEARLEEAATRDEVLQGKPRGLRPEDAELLNRAVQKFALPELRRRAAVKYFFG